MSTRDIVDNMERVWRSLSELCSSLTAEEWQTSTDCPGWTVQDQIAHMLGSEERLLGRSVPQHTPRGDLSHVKNEVGQRNEIWVDWRRAKSGVQVLAEFRAVIAERLQMLRAMHDTDFAAMTDTPIGPGAVSDLLQIRIFDAWIHEQDIRRAVGQPGHLAGPVAEHAVGRVALALPYVVGRKVKPADGTTVVLHIMGPAGRTVAVLMDGSRARLLDPPPATPTVRLAMDVEIFTCLGCGRVEPRQALQSGRVQVSGDMVLGEMIVAQMNIMI